jgi:hypothetical protein
MMIAAKMPMMAMTVRSSIRVKPLRRRLVEVVIGGLREDKK